MPPTTTNAHPPKPKPAPTKAAPINIKLLLIGNPPSASHLSSSASPTRPGSPKTKPPPPSASISVIWDTAGQERFRTITASYYRGAQGVVLVYDVTSRESFESLPRWWDELETYLGGEGRDAVVKIVVGNKVDKEFSRQVSTQEGQAFATRMGCFFVESSAKTDVGVTEAFTEVVKRILVNTKDTPNTGVWRTDHGRGGVPGGVQVVGGPEHVAGGCAC
ncbi:ras family-domain-containing protein [Mucidula mucida]|nr:ras family-domain-containing protein [Mucidula mucida]